MNEAWLDGLVALFHDILRGGYERVSPEVRHLMKTAISIDLLFAAIAWMGAYLQIFSTAATALIRIAVFAMLYLGFVVLSQHFIDYCVFGGLRVGGILSGGDLTIEEFHKPSTILMKGFQVTVPINTFIESHTGWGQLWNFFTLQPLALAALGIWATFSLLAGYLTWVQILMDIVVAYVVIFLPFAPIGPLAFIAERGLGLLVSSAARLGVTALLTAISWPLVDHFLPADGSMTPLLTAKGNVDMAACSWLMISVGFILVAVWSISSLVAGFFAGGPVLSWSHLVPGLGTIRSMTAGVRSGGGGGSSASRESSTPRAPMDSAPSVAQIRAGVPWRHS